jgi:hypothetical protein
MGIGTTTPGTTLSLGDTGANTINISNTSTSTFGTGINLTSGCFAVNGVCVGGGSSGPSASSTLLADSNNWTGANNNFANSVKIGTGNALTNSPFHVGGSTNGYFQANIQNLSNGGSASSDWVATNDIGNDTTYYVNMGINSSGYNDPAYSITDANDAYLYAQSESLAIGTATSSPLGVLKFHTGGTLASNERMRITAGGLIGVGTTTPWALFSLAATSTNAGNIPLFAVSTSTQTSTSTAFVITSLGKVGIGTTTPYNQLSVSGGVSAGYFNADNTNATSTFAGGVSIGSGAGDSVFQFTNDINAWSMGYLSSDKTFRIASSTELTTNVGIALIKGTDIKVAIGKATASDVLDVNGDVRLGTGTTGCLKDADGTTLTGTCSSDENLKTNIQELPRALDKIALLTPSTFNWRSEQFPEMNLGTSTQIGVIAQNVESVFPELVSVDSAGFKQVNYAALPIITLKAVKDISSILDLNRAPSTTPSLSIDQYGNVGIGTSTPGYKLQVMGDVAAQSFVNVSTRDAKKDISYLASSDKLSILDSLRGINIASYHYNNEASSSALHLGLIAEEAPTEVLAQGGKGVDMYKFSSYILGGVQALDQKVTGLGTKGDMLQSRIDEATSKLDKLTVSTSTTPASEASSTLAGGPTLFDLMDKVTEHETKIAAIQMNINSIQSTLGDLASTTANLTAVTANLSAAAAVLAQASSSIQFSASTTEALASSTSAELASSTSFIGKIAEAVKGMMESAGGWVMEKFTARVAYIDRVEAKTVAISQGMEITDQATGQIYCVTIKNGDWNKVQGACGVEVRPQTPAEVSPQNTATSTEATPQTGTSTPATPEVSPQNSNPAPVSETSSSTDTTVVPASSPETVPVIAPTESSSPALAPEVTSSQAPAPAPEVTP